MLTTNSNVVECLDVNKKTKKCTGPRTAEGKARSSRNAVKHGLTAKKVVLSGEEAEDYEAKRVAWARSFGVKDEVEAEMIDRAVAATWRLHRIVKGDTARLEYNVQHALIAYDLKQTKAAGELGRRLLATPSKFYDRAREGKVKNILETTDTDPSTIVRHLKSFAQGADWLIGRWKGLAEELKRTAFWHPTQESEAMRLLGLTEEQIVHEAVLVRIVLACEMLCPSIDEPLLEALEEDPTFLTLGRAMGDDEFDVAFELRAKWVEGLKPKDKVDAQNILKTIIFEQIMDLETLKVLKLNEIEEMSRLGAPDRALLDDSDGARLTLRYETANDRAFYRALNAFYKKRKEERSGGIKAEEEELEVVSDAVDVSEVVAAPSVEPSSSKLRNELPVEVRTESKGSRRRLRAEKKLAREQLKKRSARAGGQNLLAKGDAEGKSADLGG